MLRVCIFLLKVNISLEQAYSYYVGSTDELQVRLMCFVDFHRKLDALSLTCNILYCLKASGAYVFRPNGTFPIQSGEKVYIIILSSAVPFFWC